MAVPKMALKPSCQEPSENVSFHANISIRPLHRGVVELRKNVSRGEGVTSYVSKNYRKLVSMLVVFFLCGSLLTMS